MDEKGNYGQKIKVPVIYVKAIAHQKKVADTIQNIRIGADILAIIIGIASLGAASPLLLGLSLLDIVISTADLIIISKEKELMETEEGKAFLKNWELFSLASAGPGLLLLGKSLIIGGARLLSKITVANARNFIMAIVVKVIINNNITRLAKETIAVIPFSEIFKSGVYATIGDKLQQMGVILLKGSKSVGESTNEQFELIYKGEAIFEGGKRDLQKQFGKLIKKTDDKIADILHEAKVGNKSKLFAKTGTGGGFKYLTEVESTKMVCQEEPMSCAAACIRQLALDEGISITEKTIRRFAKTDLELGTILDNIGPAMEKVFDTKKILSGSAFIAGVEDMKKVAETISSVMGKPWIASLKSESGIVHSVIVDKIQNGLVYIRDPWNKGKGFGLNFGVEATLSIEDFEYFWKKTYHHYSLIK